MTLDRASSPFEPFREPRVVRWAEAILRVSMEGRFEGRQPEVDMAVKATRRVPTMYWSFLRQAEAAMALADEENATLRAERDWSNGQIDAAVEELKVAEAALARVKALADWFEAQPNWVEWGIHRQIRTALAAEPTAS